MTDQHDGHEQRRARKRPAAPGRKSSVWWPLAVVALVPIVLYTLFSVTEKSIQAYRAQYQAVVVRAEIEAEKRENLRLQQLLLEARGDQQIEDAARVHLGLVRPGDHAVVLSGVPPPKPAPRAVVRDTPIEPLPPWLSWLIDVFGR